MIKKQLYESENSQQIIKIYPHDFLNILNKLY